MSRASATGHPVEHDAPTGLDQGLGRPDPVALAAGRSIAGTGATEGVAVDDRGFVGPGEDQQAHAGQPHHRPHGRGDFLLADQGNRVDGDPLANVRELESVDFVMKGGKVYKD